MTDASERVVAGNAGAGVPTAGRSPAAGTAGRSAATVVGVTRGVVVVGETGETGEIGTVVAGVVARGGNVVVTGV
ncbi:MAG: hypothetical protein RLZZ518_818, partial [Actinomycetota bacterium]